MSPITNIRRHRIARIAPDRINDLMLLAVSAGLVFALAGDWIRLSGLI